MVSTAEQVESELRDFARLQARAALADADTQRAEVAEAIRAELPQQAANADILARAWLAKEYADLAAEATGVTEDPSNPIHATYGENAMKSRLRAHPDVAAIHHPDLVQATA